MECDGNLLTVSALGPLYIRKHVALTIPEMSLP